MPITIHRGTLAHYQALAPFHYRPTRPATIAHILTALADDEPIGVLVISMPPINGPWRMRAWPDLFTTNTPREHLHLVNLHLRIISRVIITPRYRAQGIAQQLVRAYLASPLTPRTEAIAAMGRASPFFERGGMTPIDFPPAQRTSRLRHQLAHLNIHPWQLADPASLLRSCRADRRRQLHHSLAVFARAHRDTRAHADSPLPHLITLAARRIACTPIAYIHEQKPAMHESLTSLAA